MGKRKLPSSDKVVPIRQGITSESRNLSKESSHIEMAGTLGSCARIIAEGGVEGMVICLKTDQGYEIKRAGVFAHDLRDSICAAAVLQHRLMHYLETEIQSGND